MDTHKVTAVSISTTFLTSLPSLLLTFLPFHSSFLPFFFSLFLPFLSQLAHLVKKGDIINLVETVKKSCVYCGYFFHSEAEVVNLKCWVWSGLEVKLARYTLSQKR